MSVHEAHIDLWFFAREKAVVLKHVLNNDKLSTVAAVNESQNSEIEMVSWQVRLTDQVRYHQHSSSVFVGARLNGLLAPPALKLKNWNTEKLKNSQIPWKQGLTPHTKAYRRWSLSATTHCEYLMTKRSLSVHITEIVRATNSVLDRTEMNIYELNELDSSVRSNAIGGFRLKHCPEIGECLVTCKLFFQKHQHKSREVNCRQPAPVRLDYHKSPSL